MKEVIFFVQLKLLIHRQPHEGSNCFVQLKLSFSELQTTGTVTMITGTANVTVLSVTPGSWLEEELITEPQLSDWVMSQAEWS